ncbi:MAG: response regulator transcription factor [Terriglobales bacterium]
MMKTKVADPCIRIAVLDSDPLRFIGFRSLLDSEPHFELIALPHADIAEHEDVQVALLGHRADEILVDLLDKLKTIRPNLPVLVTGASPDDETIVMTLASGARGYVSETASGAELARAIRIVHQGLVWAPRRVFSLLVERASGAVQREFQPGRHDLTNREQQVLEMLVAGRSNKEIANPLGIEERTVKAHVASLMRKLGTPNRVALSVHAVTHSLVEAN